MHQTQALDRFLAGVERRAFLTAHLATRNRDEALDLVQDAMCKLVQRYRDRDESEWGPLFSRILHNRIRDWQRRDWVARRWRAWLTAKRDADGTSAGEPLEEIPDAGAGDTAARVAGRRAARAVEAALRDLPARQRQAFLLRAWEGFDVAEAARAMGCSQGSVKTHYSRAVHALRARLAEHRP